MSTFQILSLLTAQPAKEEQHVLETYGVESVKLRIGVDATLGL